MELNFADFAKLEKEGRNFDCAQCPKSIQKIRKCHDTRMDFTSYDGPVFPIYINKGGFGYGFCPSKATWDNDAVALFQELLLTVEMKQFPNGLPMYKQSSDLIDILSWFLPQYEASKFARNIGMIFGGSDEKIKPAKASNHKAPMRRKSGR